MLPLIGLLHFAVVISLFLMGLRSSPLDWITKLNAIVIGVWTDLVVTALILSSISRLNDPVLYAGLSIILALPFAALLTRLGRQVAPSSDAIPGFLDRDGTFPRALIIFMLVTGTLAIGANILIALAYIPNNSDTLTYRLPKIYWYLSSGSLDHYSEGIDPRATYYPFNGALLYLPIVQYRWSVRLFTIIPFAAWSIVGLTIFRLAREAGFSGRTAIAASWLTCMTPGVLVQATSTNDEIIAAFILLIGLNFAFRFYLRPSLPDAALSMLAASLSAGTKLHVIFFWPLIAVCLALAVFWLATDRDFIGRRFFTLPVVLRMAPVALTCAGLILPFAWFNWRASGHMMDQGFSAQVLNQPYQLKVGLQNLVLHAAQTILSPLPDLDLSANAATRSSFYATYNGWLSGLFTWVNQGPDFMSAGYRFNGATQTVGWRLDENGVDIGLSYLLVIGSLLICYTRRRTFWLGLITALAFVVWFITYGLMTRYIEGFSVYLSYAFIVCAPALAFSLVKLPGRGTWVCAFLLVIITATHSVEDWNILSFNVRRNVPSALSAETWPLDLPQVDDGIARAIRQYGGAQFQATHWEIPYWSFMALDKAGQYYVGHPSRPNPSHLNIYPCQVSQAFNCLPVRIDRKASPGLALLGTFWSDYGSEWGFASGAGVERDPAYSSGYILLELYESTKLGQPDERELTVSSSVAGLETSDKLQFRYALHWPDGALIEADWGDVGRSLPWPRYKRGGELSVDIRPEGSVDVLKHVEYHLQSSDPFSLDGSSSE